MASSSPQQSRLWLRHLLTAILSPLLFLALAEGVLRVLPVTPFVQNAKELPPSFEWEILNGVEYFHIIHNLHFEPTDRILVHKTPETVRLYCSGGSTVVGEPFDHVSWPRFLKAIIEAIFPEKNFEVINGGLAGAGTSWERAMVEDITRYAPDIIIIQTGNNEFLTQVPVREVVRNSPVLTKATKLLRSLKTYGLLSETVRVVRAKVAPAILAEVLASGQRQNFAEELEASRRNFFENILDMVASGQRSGASVVLCTTPANWRDWGVAFEQLDPFRDPKQEKDPVTLNDYLTGRRLFAEGKVAEAGAAFDKAHLVDPLNPWYSYYAGRAREALGDFNAALHLYKEAGEDSLRCPPLFNGFIRDLARDRGLPLCDLEDQFERASPHRMVDANLILDYCHPSLKGYYVMASGVAGTLAKAGLIAPEGQWNFGATPDLETLLTRFGISCEDRSTGVERMAQRAAESLKFSYAQDLYWRALKECEEPNPAPMTGLAFALWFDGKKEEALALFEQAKKLTPPESDMWSRVHSVLIFYHETLGQVYPDLYRDLREAAVSHAFFEWFHE